MLRIMANENVPTPVVRLLRAQGHDVLWVKEMMRGASDAAVLARSQSEKRLVVTFDKDFGELAFRAWLPAECGVVLFRLAGNDPARDNARVITSLAALDTWAGHFSVVTDDRIRTRPLPTA